MFDSDDEEFLRFASRFIQLEKGRRRPLRSIIANTLVSLSNGFTRMCLRSDKPCALAGPSAVAILALLEKREDEVSDILSDVGNGKVTDGTRLMNKKRKRKEKKNGLGRAPRPNQIRTTTRRTRGI